VLGIGLQLCEFAEKMAEKYGIHSLRLDAYSGNHASNYIYTKLHYRRMEELLYFHGNKIPFFAYENQL